MFCTPKEQDTCEVEKRGCEGCFYNMSEEEIIANVTKMLETNDDIFEETGNHLFFSKAVAKDIQGLLDLYNKEKEKNKKLEEEIIKLRMSQLPDTSDEYKRLKKQLQES